MGHKVKTDPSEKKTINTYGDANLPPGMLTSPHIAYCFKKYHIIEDYDLSCLRAATYDMRIGGSVLTWEKGKKVEFVLGKDEDANKNIRTKVDLRPNSLTFVTTVEKFNLPKDIIARFNLKSKWVHQGLLLGTGPIVDPELQARLLIPLHNFSSQNVTLNYGDEFISVEFTKTLNPDTVLIIDKDEIKYISNRNKIFDFDKYRQRISDKKVESSVSSTFDQYDETIIDYKKSLRRTNIVGVIAALGTLIALIALVFTTWQLVSSSFDHLHEASNIIKQNKAQDIDYRAFVTKSETDKYRKELDEIKKQVDAYKLSTTSTYYLNLEVDKLKNKINELDRKLSSQYDK